MSIAEFLINALGNALRDSQRAATARRATLWILDDQHFRLALKHPANGVLAQIPQLGQFSGREMPFEQARAYRLNGREFWRCAHCLRVLLLAGVFPRLPLSAFSLRHPAKETDSFPVHSKT